MGHIGFWPTLMMGDDILVHTKRKNTETLNDASKEVGLEINVEKTKYILLSRHQNVGPNRNIKIANNLLKMCHSSNIYGRQ
jgi:hypothetical protein